MKQELEQIDKELENLKLLGATLKERLQTLQKELPGKQKEKTATAHYRRNCT